MSCDSPQLPEDGVSLSLSEDDFLNFSETTNYLLKTLNDFSEEVNCKNFIFMQKKEKHQQILDSQMLKLENERKEYVKKAETLMTSTREAKSRLMQIEHSIFEARNKLDLEEQAKEALIERIKQKQLENKQKNAKFHTTAELFRTEINRYENYLNMYISFDKENMNVIIVTFKESKKDFKGYPKVTLEIVDEKRFKVLNMYPLLEECNDVMMQIIEPHETILFINKFRKHFLESDKEQISNEK